MKVIAWLIGAILLTLLGAARLALGADVALDWDASATAGVTNYRVRYGTTSRVYTASISFSGTNRSGMVSNIPPGRWFFAATAMKQGMESDPSNEVSWTNTAFAPLNLRITGPTDALALQSAPAPSGPWKTLAVVTSSNAPLQLTAAPRQFFRAISTNLPPLPGGAP